MLRLRQILWAGVGVASLWLSGCATPMLDNCGCNNREGLFSRFGFRRNQQECCPPLAGVSLSTSVPIAGVPGCDCQTGPHLSGPIVGAPVSGGLPGGIPIEGPALPGMPPAMSTLPPGVGTLPPPTATDPRLAQPTPANPSSLRKGL